MKHFFIFGNNNLAKLLDYYLFMEGLNIEAYVLNEKYVDESKDNGLLKPLVSIEEMMLRYGSENIYVYIAVAYASMNLIRENIFRYLLKNNIQIQTYIHPSSLIAKNVTYGIGNIVLENVIIQPFTHIGSGNIFWNGVNISHDCKIGDYNYFSPGAVVSGRVIIENRCFFGSNCTVKNDIVIGAASLIGAGGYVNQTLKQDSVFVPQRGKILNKKSNEIILR